MTSERRIEANRRNALLSTGPRTEAGKAIAARNAMVHGLRAQQVLIAGESEQEFESFRDAMAEYWEPVGVLEGELVENIVVSLWRLKRAKRIEVEILEHFSQPEEKKGHGLPFEIVIRKTYTGSPEEIDEPQEPPTPRPEPVTARRKSLGEAVKAALEGAGVLSKFMRYEAHIAKLLYGNIRELERLQERRRRASSLVVEESSSQVEGRSSGEAEKRSSEVGTTEGTENHRIHRDGGGSSGVAENWSSGVDTDRDGQDRQDQATETGEYTKNYQIHRDEQDAQEGANRGMTDGSIHRDGQDRQD